MTVLTDVTERSIYLLGWPDLDRVMEPDGVAGTLVVGSPSPVSTITLAGVDAEGGGAGSPSTVATLAVTGLPSGVTFGDPGIVAPVFVFPGPIDPSNDFGDTTILMKRLIFRPPTQTLGWGWYKRYEGVSLLKKDGVWSEVPWPTNEETKEADIYLGGGRDHAVSTELAAELIGEGYAVTEEY